jgi:hypothetical protein
VAGAQFPPVGPVSLATVVKSYLYQQYSDDDTLQTFVAAQNYQGQKWVDDLNALNLPVYSLLTGDLLDWVAHGLYGIIRPILSIIAPATGDAGPYNTVEYRVLAYDQGLMVGPPGAAYVVLNDDQFKRILTWHTYKGDGWQYTTRWLKQRVHRFLHGRNGYLAVNDNTADVSITCQGTAVTIDVADSVIARILQYAVFDGVLGLPVQYSFTVRIEPIILLAGTAGVHIATNTIRFVPQLATVQGTASVSVVAGADFGNNPATIPATASVTLLEPVFTTWDQFSWDQAVWDYYGVYVQRVAYASLGGSGSVLVSAGVITRQANAIIAGVGAVMIGRQGSAAIGGVGSLMVNTIEFATNAVSLPGEGFVVVAPGAQIQAGLTLSGSGSIRARGAGPLYATVTIAGAGTIIAHTP